MIKYPKVNVISTFSHRIRRYRYLFLASAIAILLAFYGLNTLDNGFSDNFLNVKLKPSVTPSVTNPGEYRKIALLVEPLHKQKALHFVIQNALERLPQDWQVIAYLPLSASRLVGEMCSGSATLTTGIKTRNALRKACRSGRFKYMPLSSELNLKDNSIYSPAHWRNQLFSNITWWRSFNADWILTIQSDTIICKSEEPILRYGYLGGPSAPDWRFRQDINLPYSGHLNGGFSIRNVSWTIKCLESQTLTDVEDSTFSRCYQTDTEKATYKDAMEFASDNGWSGCFDGDDGRRVCPYGLHKFWAKAELTIRDYDELLDSCPGSRDLRIANL